MAKLDNPTAIAAKWATAMGSATTAYTDGVNGVQTAPGALAAAASAKYLAQVTANVQKFERNSLSVSLQDWKTAAATKGAPRLASGATAAQPKMAAFNTAFFAYLKNGQSQIDAMPTTTYEQRKAKANAQMDYNHAFPGYR